ncbi:MAG: Uncharacterised protein [Methanobacteriota archaeon]|nr:MAG: Uncharacterised protein [Euryarchaeota archaeon]
MVAPPWIQRDARPPRTRPYTTKISSDAHRLYRVAIMINMNPKIAPNPPSAAIAQPAADIFSPHSSSFPSKMSSGSTIKVEPMKSRTVINSPVGMWRVLSFARAVRVLRVPSTVT